MIFISFPGNPDNERCYLKHYCFNVVNVILRFTKIPCKVPFTFKKNNSNKLNIKGMTCEWKMSPYCQYQYNHYEIARHH